MCIRDSQVTVTRPGASRKELLSSGSPLTEDTLRIWDGEIQVRGKTRFLGYLNQEGIDTPFDNEGWFATGDLGRFDDAGNLHVSGRKDNMFTSGGENIQPEEIEERLCAVDGVVQAVVVPVHNAEFGMRPAAFVRQEGTAHSDVHLAAVLSEYLPDYKIPFAFFPWPIDPDDDSMKVRRGLFEQLAREEND